MYPILFHLGPFPIHTYGLLIAIGFLSCIHLNKKLAEKSGLNVDRVLDLCFWSMGVGFLGARILFILTRIDFFIENPIEVFKVWEGGLVFFGGLVAVVPFALWYMKKHHLPGWATADCLVPGLAISQVFGRLGCLGAGCCYGRPTQSDWGVKLHSDLVDLHLRGINLHPTQIYESVAMLLLCGGLLWIFKHRKFPGQVALSYFATYPIIRSIIEEFRGDAIRGYIIDGVLSTSQFISIAVFLGALGFLLYRVRTLKLKLKS